MTREEFDKYLKSKGINILDDDGCTDKVLLFEVASSLGFTAHEYIEGIYTFTKNNPV